MALEAGSRIGPYEIVSRIGAGGMGEVWRARDTRLDRTVAIKTLPVELAENAQFRIRFEREAKTISQLNHPHICTLHDVGENYLVMEYLEGETLADRLLRGPLPTADVLRYGIEIAEALDKAHRQKVVHRDLKPANVMITKAGAKLLDFGLAKSTIIDISVDDLTHQKPLTREGTLIGTFQYMAPEQLEGLEADARTDIFAFGALLYEMATGRRAFEAKSKTSLIAAIVSSRPEPISTVQPIAPVALDHVVEKCLEKDPEKRWQSAHDIVTELQWISDAGSKVTVAPYKAARRRHREIAAWSLAAVLAIATLFTGRVWLRDLRRVPAELRFAIAPAEGTNVITGFDTLGLALSPDGKRLVFAALGNNGRRNLYLRALSQIEPKLIPETEGAMYPFWSPDGMYIGFFADGKLRKVDTAGGPAQDICDAPSGRGASWGPNGTILVAPNVYSAIYSVPAAGGTPVAVTKLNDATDVTHRWPQWLPGGKSFLYVVRPKHGDGRGPAHLMVAKLGSSETKVLMDNATNTVYADGKLFFGRDQRLMAQAFDFKSMKLSGDPILVAPERLSYWDAKNFVTYTVSADGTLVYLPEASPQYELKIMDRTGKAVASVTEPGYLDAGAAFSPDGKRVAYSKGDGPTAREDIWIYDLERKQETRFTFEPGRYYALSWSPDGSQLMFGSSHEALGNVYIKPLKGGAQARQLVEANFWKVPGNFSPDGKRVIYEQQSAQFGQDLWVMDLASGKASIFLQTKFDETGGRFSPDGRWIAYQSNESGREEIYVRPVSGTGEQWQVSTGGGVSPLWTADGREILYTSLDGKVFAAGVESHDSFAIGTATELFGDALITPQGFNGLQDVSADGTRLLMIAGTRTATTSFLAMMKR